MTFKFNLKKTWWWVKHSVLVLVQIALLSTIVFRVVPLPVTPLMLMRFSGFNHSWVPYEKINKNAVVATMTAEDPHFNTHFGFDTKAIKEAVEIHMDDDDKRPLRGGSTVSQQTAKNVFLFYGDIANFGPFRYARKGLEIPFTLLIETMWTKRRIMEIYLNSIEMGDGIYGIEAAAQYYYRKPASKLTPQEAASIVVCYPNPRVRKPTALRPRLQKKRDRLVRWMAGYELPENLR